MNRKKSKGLTGVLRTCAGCREVKDKKEMIKISLSEGSLAVDRTGKAPGRSVYICPDSECFEKALKCRGVQRGFRRNFDDSALSELRDKFLMEIE